MAVDTSGQRVSVVGSAAGDFSTVSFDADSGARMWAARYAGPRNGGFDVPSAMTVAPDGSIHLTGQIQVSGDPLYSYATVVYCPFFTAYTVSCAAGP